MLHFLLVSLLHVVIIVTDELIDTYHGKSPCHVYIPSKPHPNGHLIHEAVSISRKHSLLFPIFNVTLLWWSKSWNIGCDGHFCWMEQTIALFSWTVGFLARASSISLLFSTCSTYCICLKCRKHGIPRRNSPWLYCYHQQKEMVTYLVCFEKEHWSWWTWNGLQ